VYYTKGHFIGWDPATGLAEAYYMAKLFHPDKFKDLDVEAEGNLILKEFYGVDGLYTWLLENSDLYRWGS
jgi:iron complex transport system substrate-binding protein